MDFSCRILSIDSLWQLCFLFHMLAILRKCVAKLYICFAAVAQGAERVIP